MKILLLVLLGLIAVMTSVSTVEVVDEISTQSGLLLRRKRAVTTAAGAAAGTGAAGAGAGAGGNETATTPGGEIAPGDEAHESSSHAAAMPFAIVNGALICAGILTAILMIAKQD
uniref:Uncharacterized protein n=1 Tax=Strigamia maritima TaxID=126957 RepID=T1IZ23_STRMM